MGTATIISRKAFRIELQVDPPYKGENVLVLELVHSMKPLMVPGINNGVIGWVPEGEPRTGDITTDLEKTINRLGYDRSTKE